MCGFLFMFVLTSHEIANCWTMLCWHFVCNRILNKWISHVCKVILYYLEFWGNIFVHLLAISTSSKTFLGEIARNLCSYIAGLKNTEKEKENKIHHPQIKTNKTHHRYITKWIINSNSMCPFMMWAWNLH